MSAADKTIQEQDSPVKKALREIRKLRAQLAESEAAKREPIAVVGVGCRLPGQVTDPESFWRLLEEGGDAIVDVPADRWDASAFFSEDVAAPGKIACRAGGFIEDVDKFDPEFFGISPREAESMDPQQRILLQVSWEALEHAGIAADRLRGSNTGVFVGIGTSDYMQLRTRTEALDSIDAYYTLGSVSHSVASGRLAYNYGFNGPTLSVDTACSSSLVAIHLACQALRLGECNMALAAGVGLILAPDNAISLSKAHMLAPDGRCKTFDAAANGFSRGEGCGVVVLKRFSDAVAEGDNILAIVRGSAVNQDGRSTGLTVPNGPAQEAVIRAALDNAGINPLDVSYVEAHGTGTELGDPIEVQALGAALCDGRTDAQALRIGSVKTNLGHLESAAGVTGFIKLVLALHKKAIPSQLHFHSPNPHIPWAELPIEVVSKQQSWPQHADTRIGGVSSFGFSGTNAHILLQEAPAESESVRDGNAAQAPDRSHHVLTLSAADTDALERLCQRYGDTLAIRDDECFPDICFSANTGRASLAARCALVAGTTREAADILQARSAAEPDPRLRSGPTTDERPRVAFLFSGQGAQHAGMGKTLYASQPEFRRAFDRCDAVFQEVYDESLCDVVFEDGTRINETTYTQPALFAYEYALASLWSAWGVTPDWVIGHSIGEYVAACVAGVFSPEDAMRLVVERGRLMGSLPDGGAMAAVLADEATVETAINASGLSISIAAANGPANTVISGRAEDVERLLEALDSDNVTTSRLHVSHAFHSELLEPVLDEFEAVARKLDFRNPGIGLISNLTGKPIGKATEITADYWRQQSRSAVRFHDGVTFLSGQVEVFVEIGPHTTLTAITSAGLASQSQLCVPSQHRDRDCWEQLLESLADVWVAGVAVDWQTFDSGQLRRRVALPNYPFSQERYWLADASTSTMKPESTESRWARVVTAGKDQAVQIPYDLDVAAYRDKWDLLARMTSAYTREALAQMGALAKPGTAASVEEVLKTCGIQPGYRTLIERWLDGLADDGALQKDANRYSAKDRFSAPTEEEISQLHSEADILLADAVGVRMYLDQSRAILTRVLRGEISPVESLFPAGSFETADAIYRDWTISRYFNSIVVGSVNAALAGHSATTPRILEIGAGTGGTTASLLQSLQTNNLEYWFTDVSDLFLGVAEERFSKAPFMRYALLDIESDPLAQGFNAGAFDIVIASNVLHTATNLEAALEAVRNLLAPAGTLVLFESTAEPRWCDATFGLLSGWQRHERSDQKSTPLLSTAEWGDVLGAAGLEGFAAFSPPAAVAEVLYQDVFVAYKATANSGQRAERVRRSENQPAKRGDSSEQQSDEMESGLCGELLELSSHDRVEAVTDHVRRSVMAVLRIDPSKPPGLKARLMDLGFDSLMAVELRGRLERLFAIDDGLSATLVFDHPTIEAIAIHICDLISMQDNEQSPPAIDHPAAGNEAATERRVKADELEGLSDDEVAAMLMKKLGTHEDT